LLLFLIGVTVSLQIGKVPGQLPAIESELGLSLFNVGLIVSIFSLIAAFGGIFIGAVSDRFGSLRLVVAGLALGGLRRLFRGERIAPAREPRRGRLRLHPRDRLDPCAHRQ
jgi:CP family cyanate transporter-like MFS transporter